jgi:putative acetyltransferase
MQRQSKPQHNGREGKPAVERAEMEDMTPESGGEVTVREFVEGDEAAFRALNEEWIVRYFKIEPKDVYALEHPRETILDKGGRIFFAVRNGEAIGCCALLAIAPGEFEVGKMAVTPSARGLGVGRLVMEAAIAAARAAGAKRLYLETNHMLTPAISLYEASGFQRIPEERKVKSPYERSDVAMEMFL